MPSVYTGSKDPFSGIWSRTLRIKIIGSDGFEKLDLKIPVSGLDLICIRNLNGLSYLFVLCNSSSSLYVFSLIFHFGQAGFLDGITNIVPGTII